MQQPPNTPDIIFEDLLQDLPADILTLATQNGAFSRARKIKTPLQLLRALLLYGGDDKSLREAAGILTMLDEPITDSSVAERLGNCLDWLRDILPRMLPSEHVQSAPDHRRFLVLDGSCIQGPGAQGVQYRLHAAIDLLGLEVVHLEITDKHTGESLKNFPLQPGDVAMTDRGYCHANAIIATLQAGVDLIVRLSPHNVVLRQPDGQKLKLTEALQDQELATVRSLPVLICPSQGKKSAQGWVHAYRLPEAQAEAARRACRRRSQKRGGTPKKETLFLAGWVMVFSSLDPSAPDGLDGDTVMALYRLRWQVELAIKRWKSLLDVGKLRAKEGNVLAEVWLHAKLLYALLIERRLRRQMGDGWVRLDRERKLSLWRPYKLVRQEVATLISGVMFWKRQWQSCMHVLSERPRKRRPQRLPDEAVAMFALPSGLYEQQQRLHIAA